ncbi:hypothetical protein VM1G_00661 [Cytospora mali]|uniref:Uncharacterized protein n=1 Tax=Cytospora mali TaxID=578113 RepID=A0A194VLS6_CYTMA|nr:hypothetical protein VM1G_00661 [Valsa mali]
MRREPEVAGRGRPGGRLKAARDSAELRREKGQESQQARGDLFPSDEEWEEAVPLDDKFAMALNRVHGRASNRTWSSKGKTPVESEARQPSAVYWLAVDKPNTVTPLCLAPATLLQDELNAMPYLSTNDRIDNYGAFVAARQTTEYLPGGPFGGVRRVLLTGKLGASIMEQ